MDLFGDRMTRLLTTLLLLAAVAGCSNQFGPAKLAETPSSVVSSNAANRYLAYEHSILIDAEEGKVRAVHAAGLAACRAAAVDLCTVLQSRITTGRYTTAALKFRAKPSGIKKLMAALGGQAEITQQSTNAEDLAGPVEDGAKKLSMLNDYRARLEVLRGRASNDVDALIKVNRELAEVQAELEAMTAKQAQLMQRIETEILDVTIRSDHNQSFFGPIARSTSDFGSNLSQGISTAITGVAYLAPWALVFGLLGWAVRKLWRRRKQAKGTA